ncbi:protein FAM234A isoform X2 [Balaenoptera musculus]|uniref:Protein FAM234A n=1 Tax=Balaenoptera musculus TaxID=9771 RepID=A0A8B8V9L5_BALMU|nr:protein FAM234A isoform X2 [Balaenoptera musculus]
MMDSKDLEAEIHPLKNENRKVQEHLGNPAGKETSVKPPPQSRLSRCRMVAFFLSLFICLFVVFVVSFIIPCPDRPASQGVWRIDYEAAVAYDFLATEDVNKDRIQDVLFLYKNTNSSRSNFSLSCADEGFSSPCTFVAAVSGANGTVLWERPVAQNRALVECGVPQPRGSGASSACIILGRPGPFIAVDSVTGETLWSHPSSFGGNVSVLSPLLQVPDIDADGVPDLLVLTQEENQVNGYVYSGSTGQQVGPPGSLGVDGTSGSILYVTSAGAHYVLIPCGTSFCSHSVKGLYEKATGRDSSLKSDPLWEGRLNATSHRLQEHSSGAVRYLMNVPGKVGEDLLLVSAEACVLLDGQELVPRWTLGAAQVLRSCSWTSAPGLSCGARPSQASPETRGPPACPPQTTAPPSSSGASTSWLVPTRRSPDPPGTACTCSTPRCPESCWNWPTSPPPLSPSRWFCLSRAATLPTFS